MPIVDPTVSQVLIVAVPAVIAAGGALALRRWSTARAEILDGAMKDFQTAENAIYRTIVNARRSLRDAGASDEYISVLRSIDPTAGQSALDTLRRHKSKKVVAAERLWRHLRGDPVPHADTLRSTDWKDWKDEYWKLRAELK